ncbi:unnamed protein product [Calicophoron daubneyi]|uniref:Histone-lysine N-methyltransferase n=1 Tax=Calicophoron daubneyi TaxID=300641 RepID=A0AAV2T9L5_CALDB
MEANGMNKASEDNHLDLLNPTSCSVRIIDKVQCNITSDSIIQPESFSPFVHSLGFNEGFSGSYACDVNPFIMKASTNTHLENNHDSFSPQESCAASDASLCAGLNDTSDRSSDLCISEKCSITTRLVPVKNSAIESAREETGSTFHAKNVSTADACYSPSVSSATYFASETQQCNGSSSQSSVVQAMECSTPTCDQPPEVNGDSSSHTPASVNDSDRIRMDLTKLDDTIDYVLSYARSDEPCEGMFVLSCRMREPAHISSPNQRANTPSSGLLASPSPSPTPSSPHSGQVTSPMLNSAGKTHSLLQPSNVPNFISTHSLPRYVVDQNSGIFQLSSTAVNPQSFPSNRTNQAVSYLNLCPTTLNTSRLQTTESQFTYQMRQPLATTTQMVFHPVAHGFQNHTVQQQNHLSAPPSSVSNSSLHRAYNSLLSPTKINLLHTPGTRVVKQSLSPTVGGSFVSYPSEFALRAPARTVVFSSPTTVCVLANSTQSASSIRGTCLAPLPAELISDSSLTANPSTSLLLDRKSFAPSQLPVSFRQPVVPMQPVTSCISSSSTGSAQPNVPETIVPLVHSSPTEVVRTLIANSSTGSRKRNSAANSGPSKRRRTSVAASHSAGNVSGSVNKGSSAEQSSASSKVALSIAHEGFEKLKVSDIRSFVSAPTLKPYTSVLPPVGGTDPPSQIANENDDRLILHKRGLKYIRSPMTLRVPKCFYPNVTGEKVDEYIVQHLQINTPQSPLLCAPNNPRPRSRDTVPVCPSPEPISFENHMMALFSSMRKSPRCERNYDWGNSKCGSIAHSLAVPSFVAKMLPMVSEPSPNSEKPDPERCTPPLPLFHMPNPRLICEPIHIGSSERRGGTERTSTNEFHPSTNTADRVSRAADSLPGSRLLEGASTSDGTSVSSSPLIDSETGEVVAGRRLVSPIRSPSAPTLVDTDKLHITFTINPSVTGGIPKIISRIADLLGIDPRSVCYQVTRSGAQITLDQKQSQSESVMRSLESHLREHFTPLSLHFEKTTLKEEHPASSSEVSLEPTDRHTRVDLYTHDSASTGGLGYGADAAGHKTDFHPSSVEFPRYPEEAVSIMSLLVNKRSTVKPCHNCDKLVPPHSGVRKCLEDLANLTGLTAHTDSTGEFVFCSGECLLEFTRSVSCRRPHTYISAGPNSTNANSCASELRQPTLVCDLPASIPVLLQNVAPKSLKGVKRQQSNPQSQGVNAKRRAGNNVGGPFKSKKWKGLRWRPFTTDLVPSARVTSKSLDQHELEQLLRSSLACLRLPSAEDKRSCILCSLQGDAPENGLGRLLPFDADKWLHINCALWCFEVYETVGGSLNNVDLWLKKAVSTACTHCGRSGAGLPCYNPRCTYTYHVPCAITVGCMFFTDRGMYCPQHQPKEAHPMQLSSLDVRRRVYISRDENEQVGGVIHEEDRLSVVRIGTVCLINVGQLLPHQIESGFFHTRRYIYPVGFRTCRIYWSMRKPHARARYLCEILEEGGHPLFRVTAIDSKMKDESFVSDTCSGVWRSILSKIETLREENRLVRLFSQHLKGEELYGLSEPHIVRAVESLPGVDCLRDYVFNFGRMELIAEMPLALNPSGCARSEPKMQTYLRRSKIGSQSTSLCPNTRLGSLPGFRRATYPALPKFSSDSSSKQYISSRSQQYRRLKGEVNGNVILGRSRIQGLGLFAARPLEPQTMVIEYIGELIRLELADKREKEYEAHNRGIYMFRLDDDTVIDATVCGGLARYINHSCQPNCYAEYLNLGDHAHIVIITNSHIDKGEELCYDYNFDLEDGGNKIPCLCRAPNCRKWMN